MVLVVLCASAGISSDAVEMAVHLRPPKIGTMNE